MILISDKIPGAMKAYLETRYGEVLLLPPNPHLPDSVAFHTDLSCCLLGKTLVCSPFLYRFLATKKLPCKLYCGTQEPGPGYPAEIAYNAAAVGKYLFCLQKHTNPAVLYHAERLGFFPVAIKQGYAKCSIAGAGNALVTADTQIAKKAEGLGFHTLLTDNTGVALPGYAHGFIGGASITIGRTLFFTGDISALPDYPKIAGLCEQENIHLDFHPGLPLVDYGSPIYIA